MTNKKKIQETIKEVRTKENICIFWRKKIPKLKKTENELVGEKMFKTQFFSRNFNPSASNIEISKGSTDDNRFNFDILSLLDKKFVFFSQV